MSSTQDREATQPDSATPRRLRVRHLWLFLPFLGLGFRAVTSISDNSFLWHVRAGEAQLATGEVLRTDPFSFTQAGTAWRTQSWLIELLYGWLFELTGGVQWVPASIFVILGAAFAYLGIAVYRAVRDPLKTALVLLLMMWISFFYAVPRPVLASFLLIALTVVVLQRRPHLDWALVPIIWLWAAVHGSWVVGGALIALEAVRTRSRRLFEIGLLAALATLFTAHGIGTWEIFISFMANRDALAFLSEWARPDFTDPFIAPALLVALALVAGVATRRIRRSHLVVIVPFAVFGVLQLRSVFPALIVLVPYATMALAPSDVAPTGGPGASAAGSPLLNKAMAAALVALTIVTLARPVVIDDEKLPPPEALAALDDRPVFHGPAAGGLLIYAEWPDRLVFIDDRAELFGADGFGVAVDALEGRAYEGVFADFSIGQALLEVDWPLIDRLSSAGWSTVYEDDHWVVQAAP